MTLWQIIKKKVEKRQEVKKTAERTANPLDKNLPFGLHIDGKIEIKTLLPESMAPRFIQGSHIIEGFSEFNLVGYKCFRVLIHSEQKDTDSYLLILQKDQETLTRWFTQLDEVYPGSEDEWDFWLSEKDGSIGISQFKSKDEILYDRIWGPKGDFYVEPIHYRERLVLDRYNETETQVVEQRSMLYGREVEDDIYPCDEYILLSACTEHDGSHVSIDVGVDLDFSANIKVIY